MQDVNVERLDLMVQNDSACGLYAKLLSVSVVSCIDQASVSVVGLLTEMHDRLCFRNKPLKHGMQDVNLMVQNDSACGLYANLLSVSVVSCINQASVSVVGLLTEIQRNQPIFVDAFGFEGSRCRLLADLLVGANFCRRKTTGRDSS